MWLIKYALPLLTSLFGTFPETFCDPAVQVSVQELNLSTSITNSYILVTPLICLQYSEEGRISAAQPS